MDLDFSASQYLLRFFLNSAVLLLLLRFVYYQITRDRDFLFGFFLFGHGVFLITAMMQQVEVTMGFAFGLFAVLSMLRYRTEALSIRNMTYLFLVVVISLVFAVGNLPVLALLLINLTLCGVIVFAELSFFAPRTTTRVVYYDNTENIKLQNRDKLMLDLEERLGIKPISVDVGGIDFLKDSVKLTVTFSVDDVDNKIGIFSGKPVDDEESVSDSAPAHSER